MNQDTNLLENSPYNLRSFEKTTPLPATASYYRSRLYTSNININPLIAACDQLLCLTETLKSTDYPNDSEKFLHDLAHEIRSFEHRAQIANYQHDIIIAARYALCCLLDEVIKATAWGQKNNWAEKNLLFLFHNENYGGERFFAIIDRTLGNIAANLHLIELLYLCLNLGFAGKHQHTEHGQNELIALTNKLYQIIGHYSHLNRKSILVCEETKPETIPNHEHETVAPLITAPKITTKKLLSIVSATAIAIGGLIYLGVSIKLKSNMQPIYTTIEQVFENKN